MSGLLHPRGPERASVYWRRRVLVAGVVVGVLILAGHAMRQPQPVASVPGVVVLTSATPMETTVPQALPSVVPEPTVDAQGNALCSGDDVKVSVAVDRKTTTVGLGVHVRMTVKNISGHDCLRDVGSGANEISIASRGTTVWSTDDCNPSTASDSVRLPTGATWSVKVVWNGKVTDAGCTIKGDAPSGSYSVIARNGQQTSTRARFTIG